MAYGFGPTWATNNDAIDTSYTKVPTAFSLRAYLRWDGVAASGDMAIAGKRLPTQAFIVAGSDGGQAIFVYYDYLKSDGSNDLLFWNFLHNQVQPLRDGCWVALRCNMGKILDPLVTDKDCRIFIDGVDRGTGFFMSSQPAAGSRFQANGASPMRIGRVQDRYGGQTQWRGEIGDIAMYDYPADDATLALWSTPRHPLNDTQGLLFYFPLRTDAIDWKTGAAGTVTGTTQRTSPLNTNTPSPLPTPPPYVAPDPTKTKRSLDIGNSLSWETPITGSERDTILASVEGVAHFSQVHYDFGKQLNFVSQNPTGGSTLSSFATDRGKWQAALAGYTDWNQLTLQPFQETVASAIEGANRILQAAKTNNPNIQPYWFQAPGNRPDTGRSIASFNAQYDAATDLTGVNPSKQYHLDVKAGLDTLSGMKPLLFIPIYEAMKRFNDRSAGLTGITEGAWNCYADAVHNNTLGRYLKLLCFIAVQDRINPVGTPLPAAFNSIDPAVVNAVQLSVKESVLNNPLTGVLRFVNDPVIAPTASVAAIASITTASTNPVNAIVTYTDTNPGEAIDVTSLGAPNITVSNGSNTLTVSLVGSYTNNTPLVVTYAIAPPSGGWTSAQNGTWTLAIVASQVKNTLGAFVAANAAIATFTVNIAAAVTPPATSPTKAADTRNPYPITCYPGQSQFIQLFTAANVPYKIPATTTAIARCVNVVGHQIANLAATVFTADNGLLRITLPDDAWVRRWARRKLLWDMALILPGGIYKYLGISTFDIRYSPSLWDAVVPAIAPIPTPTPTPTPTPGTGTTSTTPAILCVQDQTWVDDTGRKVLVTIERQADGSEYFKLTEITSTSTSTDVPTPPAGRSLLTTPSGDYLTGTDGAYLTGVA